MSPFDSLDDDPLLHGDPFASPDGTGEDGENETESDGESAKTESDPLLATGSDVDDESIFEEEEPQIVVRSEEDISSGELAGINAALRNFSRQGLFHLLDRLTELGALLRKGWVLDRIEFRNPPSASLAFILKREEGGD